jgi:hypothetical protein
MMSNYPKIEIKLKEGSEDQVLTGANCEVLIDGKKIPFLTKVSFEVETGKLAKVSLETIGNVVISGVIGEYEEKITPLCTENMV